MSFASPVTPGSAAAPALGPKSRGVRRVGRATPVPTRLPLLARMQLGVERRAHGREAARGTRRPTQAPDVGAVTIPVAARPERVTRECLRAGDPRAKLPLPEPLASTLPSSSGPGRGPLKAETRVRLPLGRPGSPLRDGGRPPALTAEGAWNPVSEFAFAFLDCEFGGLDPELHDITEIAVIATDYRLPPVRGRGGGGCARGARA